MREFLLNNGWIHYATDCPCRGLGKYYKHQDFPDYRVVIKGGFGIIRKNGVEIFKTKVTDELIFKIKELTK